MSTRKIILFCALTISLGWLLQFALLAKYGSADNPAALPLGLCIMCSPALVTLGFASFDRESRKRICWRPKWPLLPLSILAFVVPTLIAFATLFAMKLFRWGTSEWFVFSRSGVAVTGGPWLLGKSAQTWAKFIANVVVTGGAFAFLNGLGAIGEELGWRGFLQGLLVERLGINRGLTLLGLIWAFWHLPLLLTGYNYPQHPLLGAFILFPAQLVAGSFFLGWLTIRSGSFWAAAVAHGAVNSIEEGVLSHILVNGPHLYLDFSRLFFTVLTGLVFWLLLRRANPNTQRVTPKARMTKSIYLSSDLLPDFPADFPRGFLLYFLLPLNRARRFRTNIVNNPAHPRHLIHHPRRDTPQHIHRQS